MHRLIRDDDILRQYFHAMHLFQEILVERVHLEMRPVINHLGDAMECAEKILFPGDQA